MAIKKKVAENQGGTLNITPLDTGVASFYILGTAGLIQNQMAQKAKMELLFPHGRLTESEKTVRLKHHPLDEYRSAVYAPKDKNYETRIVHPSGAFRKAMAEAALDTPGAKKTQTIRLTWIEAPDSNVLIYGIPQLYMRPVRMGDQNRTPDIRTRAIIPQWCCILTVRFVKPQLTQSAIGNLLARSGMLIGIGDDRHEKGGDHGLFEVIGPDDPQEFAQFQKIVKTGGRAVQEAALLKPQFYDAETKDLYSWWEQEMTRREREREQPAVKNGKKKAA